MRCVVWARGVTQAQTPEEVNVSWRYRWHGKQERCNRSGQGSTLTTRPHDGNAEPVHSLLIYQPVEGELRSLTGVSVVNVATRTSCTVHSTGSLRLQPQGTPSTLLCSTCVTGAPHRPSE